MATTDTETWTLDQVAERIHMAPSTLVKMCRAKKVRHVHIGDSYSMTPTQVSELLDRFTEEPKAPEPALGDIDRQRVMAEMARKPRRAAA